MRTGSPSWASTTSSTAWSGPQGRCRHLPPSGPFQAPATSNLQKTVAKTGPRRRALTRAVRGGGPGCRPEAAFSHLHVSAGGLPCTLGRAGVGHVPQPGEWGANPFAALPPALCVWGALKADRFSQTRFLTQEKPEREGGRFQSPQVTIILSRSRGWLKRIQPAARFRFRGGRCGGRQGPRDA